MRASRPAVRAALPSATLLCALLPLAPAPARASADIDCYPDLRIAHATFTRCNLMSALSPGNDTRANLLLLLLDRDGEPARSPPAPPLPADAVPLLFWSDFRDRLVGPPPSPATDFARGEGSRCLSKTSGTAAFKAALTAAVDVPAEDRTALIGVRNGLDPDCAERTKPKADEPVLYPPDPIRSATGQAFSTYEDGANAFYLGYFDEALADFAKLHGNANAWLADTADYMVARTLVNQMQVGAFDDYGDRVPAKTADPAQADRATAGLETYLRDHPHGAYAASARGLERRVDWVAGRSEALAARYATILARPLAERSLDDAAMSEEIADKLLPKLVPAKIHDPILLAAFDLAAMRAPDETFDKKAEAPKRPDSSPSAPTSRLRCHSTSSSSRTRRSTSTTIRPR